MSFKYSKERVEAARASYPNGTRIELISFCNDERDMPMGLRGAVVGVDDQPALLMHWDNGRRLSILLGEDHFRKLTPEEVEAENQEDIEEEEGPTLSM